MATPTNFDPHSSDDVESTPAVDVAPSSRVSRRGFGRHLLGASAVAVLVAMGKQGQAQAAPLTDTWKLGGNTGVNTDGSNFLGTLNVAPLVFKTTAAAGSAPVERMRITPAGTIGINTTTPAGRLHSKHTSVLPAIIGENLWTEDGVTGVLGKITSKTPGTDSAGVRGVNNGTNGNGVGVKGEGYTGVRAQGQRYGVWAEATSDDGGGVRGVANNGLWATGVYGSSYSGTGVYGDSYYNAGVYGPSERGIGVKAHSESNNGVQGISGSGTGIYGFSGSGFAGRFVGKVHVTGTLSKGGGSFKIDHPLAPDTKYLYHSFVESPDMMNIYNGNVTLDAKGEAVVTMPAWFEALNMEFRYQLTAIGAPGPDLYIAEMIKDNRFKIAGGKPGMLVSWQVTGIRQDAFANANRIPVEEDKTADERGKYLHPKAHGKPESAGVDAERMKKMREKNESHPRP